MKRKLHITKRHAIRPHRIFPPLLLTVLTWLMGIPGAMTADTTPNKTAHMSQTTSQDSSSTPRQGLTQNNAAKKNFPAHWGPQPPIQTRDYRPLPGGYGMGSSTLAKWIQENLDRDNAHPPAGQPSPTTQRRYSIKGELKKWHKVTLELEGPMARESDTQPNPFLDFRLSARFTHSSGRVIQVPGYFAADGKAADSSAHEGNVWRIHFAPPLTGNWLWDLEFVRGSRVAVDESQPSIFLPHHGLRGSLTIGPSDKTGRDFRAQGRLEYVHQRYLQFADSKRFFLKAGADSPETLLACSDMDGGMASNPSSPMKSWADHEKDWRPGDPEWQDGKGHGIIGALNYLASTGANAFSFLTYNAGGDGDNVWPFTSRDDKFHYDVSKLDQWGILLDHATSLGLYLHFKLQETEMDDHRHGPNRKIKATPESLDGGQLGDERRLYCRELIARFAHNLALNWNIGEENTQSTAEIQAMADYLHRMDPYQNTIVIHTYPQEQDKVYTPLLGNQSRLTGVSLQNEWNISHQRVLYWIQTSQSTGRPWVVANDEQGPADLGVPPDPGFENFSGTVAHKNSSYDLNSIRKFTLWGTLLAGGAGVEYYFGYKLPQNDLNAQNWRSRDLSWKYAAIALRFFEDHQIPFHLMENRDDLVGNPTHSNERYCFAQAGSIYIIYLPEGGTSHIDLSSTPEDKQFQIRWFNPRHGGPLTEGSIQSIQGGSIANIGMPPDAPDSDWLVLLR